MRGLAVPGSSRSPPAPWSAHPGIVQPMQCRWVRALWPLGQPSKQQVQTEARGGGTRFSLPDLPSSRLPAPPSHGRRGQAKTQPQRGSPAGRCYRHTAPPSTWVLPSNFVLQHMQDEPPACQHTPMALANRKGGEPFIPKRKPGLLSSPLPS